MTVLKRIDKPEYFFRPKQLLLRIARFNRPKKERRERLLTPWGLPIDADIHDDIGISLWHLGVYDLIVSETLWRLADPGEHHLDVGANFGYMTALLAARAGSEGKVTSFEPHPAVFANLESNAALWTTFPKLPTPKLVQAAVAHEPGTAKLCIPSDFDTNHGIAHLKSANAGSASMNEIEVQVVTLDELLGPSERIGVMKVDTEGSEVDVFAGARKLIETRRIRDIIFEDHGVYPTPAMSALEKSAYIVYRLQKTFFGPRLVSATHRLPADRWEPVSYVATLDPLRLVHRMHRRGWRVLAR